MDNDLKLGLDLLATMQKTYALLYQTCGVCDISDDHVQLTNDDFRAAFPDAVEEKPFSEHFNLLETTYNGVKFTALTMVKNDVSVS